MCWRISDHQVGKDSLEATTAYVPQVNKDSYQHTQYFQSEFENRLLSVIDLP